MAQDHEDNGSQKNKAADGPDTSRKEESRNFQVNPRNIHFRTERACRRTDASLMSLYIRLA
jgi:hypothetical protein